MTTAYVKAGKPELAMEKLQAVVARVEGMKRTPEVTGLLIELQGREAIVLHQSGKTEEAAARIESVLRHGQGGIRRGCGRRQRRLRIGQCAEGEKGLCRCCGPG